MKKLLFIFILIALFSNVAKSEPLLLSCQIEDKSEGPYFLGVDLINKTIDRAGNLYKIISISENSVKAERRIKLENKRYVTTIILDRYHGNMTFINTAKSSIDQKFKIIEHIKFECNNYPVF